jgi:hypothetical protein
VRKRSASFLLVMLCLALESSGAFASRPNAATVKALEDISTSRPCAAVALLYVLLKADAARSGVFYFPGVPTRYEVARFLNLDDRGVEDFPLQTDLYGEVNFYTEIRWELETGRDRVVIVSATARLVSAAGVQLHPVHEIEPLTRVLMVGQTLRVLPATNVE